MYESKDLFVSESESLCPAQRSGRLRWLMQHIMPNFGTLVLVIALMLLQNIWVASGNSPTSGSVAPEVTPDSIIPQGFLADDKGHPIDSNSSITFPLYSAPPGGNAPQVSLTQNAIPGFIPYQGSLTDASGRPINGSINITFRLYSASTGGTALWTEAHTGSNTVPVQEGLFNVLLGSLKPIPSGVWNNSTLYLSVQVGSDAEMTPREPIGQVPYATTSQQALNIAVGSGTVSYGHQIPMPAYPDGTNAVLEQCEWLVSPKEWSFTDNNCTDNHGIMEESVNVAADGIVTGWRAVTVWNNCDTANKNIQKFNYLVICTR